MRSLKDIFNDKRFFCVNKEDKGGYGYLMLHEQNIKDAVFVMWDMSDNWDHVVIGNTGRKATEEEIKAVMDIFFEPNDYCVRYYFSEGSPISDDTCMVHLWKPQKFVIYLPPQYYEVYKEKIQKRGGDKNGQYKTCTFCK